MHDHDDHRHGLQYDLEALAEQRHRRRSVLAMMGGGSLAALAAAFPGFVAAAELCIADPETTNGPYPADGSNTAPGGTSNILTESGVVRSDIRSSFGTSTNTAPGVPLTLNIKVGDAASDCAALAGYAVYVWHCTHDGLYSLYTLPDENYLRGVQIADADGMVSFTTIFPGCYRGRWPHIHFEVYPDAAAATDRRNAVLTSQFAMPADACKSVYDSTAGYEASIQNLAEITVESDNVFHSGTAEQISAMTPALSGSPADGFVADVAVGIAV